MTQKQGTPLLSKQYIMLHKKEVASFHNVVSDETQLINYFLEVRGLAFTVGIMASTTKCDGWHPYVTKI
jgi:hypothetical protein